VGGRNHDESNRQYLAGGETLEDFLEGFPTVSRAIVIEALEDARDLRFSL